MATIIASRALMAGASRYMGSLIVGVLLAPVLPDMAVDVFGTTSGLWNATLRLGSLVLVLGGCVVAYRMQLARARRRALSLGYVLAGLADRELLILPIGFRSGYTAISHRTGSERTITEWLVGSCHPRHVIGVHSRQTRSLLPALRTELEIDQVTFEPVEISDAGDPETAVDEAQSLVTAMIQARSLGSATCYVDTTGGTIPMSLAMLRLGSVLGVECTYVSSELKDGAIVPGTQKGRAFNPAAFFTVNP